MTSERTKASVIIPARNSARWIAEQLSSLNAQVGAPPFEILVCDNGSTDETARVAREFPSRWPLRVINASGPATASHARNVGVRAAKSEYVLFCDSDDLVDPHWVRSLVDAVEQSGGAIVAGAIHHERFNSPDVLAAYGIRSDPILDEPRPDDPAFRTDAPPFAGFLPTAGGGNFAMRRDDYLRLGGMDPSYPGGSEETDFSWRVQLSGIPLVSAPRAVIHYRLKDSPRELFRQQRIQQKARILLWTRYGRHGMNGPSWKASLSAILKDLVQLPISVATFRGRLSAARSLGGHLGAIQGMFLYRLMKRLPTPQIEHGNRGQADT